MSVNNYTEVRQLLLFILKQNTALLPLLQQWHLSSNRLHPSDVTGRLAQLVRASC